MALSIRTQGHRRFPLDPVLALCAGLVVADTSIVTLALPQLLRELNTSVEGVAAVLGLYTLVLAVALPALGRLGERFGSATLGSTGFTVFAIGAVVCASAGTLPWLLVGRAIQALGGAGALVASFGLLDAARRGRGAWLGAAILSGAVGPALGGALTQAFDWRAIFIVQAPLGLLGALTAQAASRRRAGTPAPVLRPPLSADTALSRPVPESADSSALSPWRSAAALILLSGALSAVLFLLVLLLVAGWNVSPLSAAVAVSVLPVAAALGTRVHGDPRVRASFGCVLVGGGVLALAFLPEARLAWTLAPQALAGAGMGMALPALAGGLLFERTAREGSHLLSLRHVGIALVLLALAPLIADRLKSATHQAKLRGVALVLDAQIQPQKKIELAPGLLGSIDANRPRASLRTALAQRRGEFMGTELLAYDHLARGADATVLAAIEDSFKDAFLIAGALALLAGALLVAPRGLPVLGAIATLVAVIAVLLVYTVEHHRLSAAPVALQNPCAPRALPSAPGLSGNLQEGVLVLLDKDACRLHTSREELVLALGDANEASRFAREHHGENPRSLSNLLESVL